MPEIPAANVWVTFISCCLDRYHVLVMLQYSIQLRSVESPPGSYLGLRTLLIYTGISEKKNYIVVKTKFTGFKAWREKSVSWPTINEYPHS